MIDPAFRHDRLADQARVRTLIWCVVMGAAMLAAFFA